MLKNQDTYNLSIVTCFCANIDPESSYKYGSPVDGYDKILLNALSASHKLYNFTQDKLDRFKDNECAALRKDLNFIYWVKSAVDMSPIIINYFLRLLIVYVISKTRQETVSK